jgi:Pentapeptide repeats (8 copies)
MSNYFSHKDLRDRSFKGQNLIGVNFSGSDLRGCDFSYAQLVGANFQNIRTGRTLKQVLPFIIVAITVALLLFYVLNQLIFASLGQTPEDPAWTYVLGLYGILGIAGMGAVDKFKPLSVLFRMMSAAASALLGFFYLGSWTQNDPKFAISGAIACGLIAAGASFWNCQAIAIALNTARAITRYGLAFLIAAIAINYLSTQNPWGLLWGFLSMLYIQFSITALLSLAQQFKQIGGTSFRGATVTHANFDQVRLSPTTDFSNAIGTNFGK